MANPAYTNYRGPIQIIVDRVYADATVYLSNADNTTNPSTVTANALSASGPLAPRSASGVAEDAWGIGRIAAIKVGGLNNLGLATGTKLWDYSGGANSVELTFTYSGLADTKVKLNSQGHLR